LLLSLFSVLFSPFAGVSVSSVFLVVPAFVSGLMVSLAAVCSGSDLGVGWVVGSPRRKDFAFCLLRLFLFAVVSVCRFQVWVGEGLLVAVVLVFFGCWWCLQPDVLLWRLVCSCSCSETGWS
jgi:hypothetical protein